MAEKSNRNDSEGNIEIQAEKSKEEENEQEYIEEEHLYDNGNFNNRDQYQDHDQEQLNYDYNYEDDQYQYQQQIDRDNTENIQLVKNEENKNTINISNHEVRDNDCFKDFNYNKYPESNECPINMPFNFNDEDRISRTSKTSNASLLRDLEDKWEMIEKEKREKSRKPSRKPSNSNLDRNEKGINNNANHKIPLQKVNNERVIKSNSNLRGLHSHTPKETNIRSIKYREDNTYNNPYEDNEFDSFIEMKAKQLEKFKKYEVDMGTEKKMPIYTNSNAYTNFSSNLNFNDKHTSNNNNNNQPSIVYESNCKKWNDQSQVPSINSYADKPSFLKSNINYSNKSLKKNPLLFRGSHFTNVNTIDNIDNLVYESGSGFNPGHEDNTNNTSRTFINPSKNLINKMQNIYGIITHTNNSNNCTPLITKPNNDSQDYMYIPDGANTNIDTKMNTNSNLNSLDKSYTLKNLDKEFDNIFGKINPNYRRVDTSLKINYKINKISEGTSKGNIRNDSNAPTTNDPVLDKKLNKLFKGKDRAIQNNTNSSSASKLSGHSQDKIFQKISENSSLLSTLFRSKTNSSTLNNNSSKLLNSIKSSYLISTNEKLFGKNDFDDLMNKMSAVNSVKVKKLLSLNN